MARAGKPLADVADYMAERVASAPIAAYAAATVRDGASRVAFGGELVAGSGRSVTAHSLFHICSCSKAFTALLFARLVEAGVTSWDHPVLPTVPEFELADSWVSRQCVFRDLAGMRIGLTREGIAEWGFRPEAPVEKRLARVRAMAFDAPFRDRFSYSNLGYLTLACAAARLGGASYQELMQRFVLSPLKLTRATLQPNADLVSPHLPIGGGMTPVPELTGENSQGSARVHLCAEDAATWIQAMLEASRGRSAASAELFSCQYLVRPRQPFAGLPTAWGYGFGWSLADHEGRRIFTHGGGGRGWRAMAILDPDRNAGVMVMLAHDGDEGEAMALELLDLTEGRRPRPRSAATRAKAQALAAERRPPGVRTPRGPVRPIAGLAGVYEGPVTGRVSITSSADGDLSVALEDAPAFDGRLRRTDGDAFELDFDNIAMSRLPRDEPFRFRFQAGASGAARLEATYIGRLKRIDR